MGGENCFIEQKATKEILLRVTNICGQCYGDLQEGDDIFYDMTTYRYLCKKCKEELSQKMNDDCEIEEERDSLF